MAPEMRPMTICWYDGSSTKSGCILCANFLISWYAVKLAPWFVACRSAVNDTPRYSVETPSSRTMVYTACPALRYRGASRGSASECDCACSRILTTSIGVTTATASVIPAPRPAEPLSVRHQGYAESVPTDEDTSGARLASRLVGKPALVRLETGESNGHFGHDT